METEQTSHPGVAIEVICLELGDTVVELIATGHPVPKPEASWQVGCSVQAAMNFSAAERGPQGPGNLDAQIDGTPAFLEMRTRDGPGLAIVLVGTSDSGFLGAVHRWYTFGTHVGLDRKRNILECRKIAHPTRLVNAPPAPPASCSPVLRVPVPHGVVGVEVGGKRPAGRGERFPVFRFEVPAQSTQVLVHLFGA